MRNQTGVPGLDTQSSTVSARRADELAEHDRPHTGPGERECDCGQRLGNCGADLDSRQPVEPHFLGQEDSVHRTERVDDEDRAT